MRPPPKLSKRARAKWREIVSGWDLDEARLQLLEEAMGCLTQYEADQKTVEREGRVVVNESTGVSRPHPLLGVMHHLHQRYLRFMKALNLDHEETGPIGRPPGR